MTKIRVNQLAKELGLENARLLELLHKLKIEAKSHSSSIDEEAVKKVKALVKEEAHKPAKEKKPEPHDKPAAAKTPVQHPPVAKTAHGQPAVAAAPTKTVAPTAAKPLAPTPSTKPAVPAPQQPPVRPAAPPPAPPAPPAPPKPIVPLAKAVAEKKDLKLEARPMAPAAPAAPPAPAPAEKEKVIRWPEKSIPLRQLIEITGIPSSEMIKEFMMAGVLVTINQSIEIQLASRILPKFGWRFEKPAEEAQPETPVKEMMEAEQVDETKLVLRPPVVTIMGHVDHGKTKLLDAIRKTKVAESEAGGITQHIGAYQVKIGDKKVTFLDTPGHEAFTQMRARGAQATDIAILVVAADDGVMPQTEEAIDHAKAAKVPIIVAINKMDKPEANPQRVKQQLGDHGLVPEEWGGQTVMVPVSAKMLKGIDDLLEMILLVAEVQELKADPTRKARGVVVESKLDKGRGPVATVLVKSGTLKTSDYFCCGVTSGRVRALFDDKGQTVKEAPPSMPVLVLGADGVPEAGDIFQVVSDEKRAKFLASIHQEKKSRARASKGTTVSLENLADRIKKGKTIDLNLILKTDVHGSLEALNASLETMTLENIRVRIIHTGTGEIAESDVMLAQASEAIIIGFHVGASFGAKKMAEESGVSIRLYEIIYDVIEDIKAAMIGMLKPEYEEVVIGRAKVRNTFRYSKYGLIAGCYVTEGKLVRDSKMRIKRDGQIVHEGRLTSLKRFKEDAREVASGFECGVALTDFGEFRENDEIETYEMREKPRRHGPAAKQPDKAS